LEIRMSQGLEAGRRAYGTAAIISRECSTAGRFAPSPRLRATRARATQQIVNLLLLAPDIQEETL